MSSAEYLNSLFGMDGQVAVIIGGAGALGLCLSTGLGKAGAKIVVADVNSDACKAAVEKLTACGVDAIWETVNVTDKDSLRALLATALKLTGKVDMLVNCAGINVGNSFIDVDPDQWDKILAVNLKGTMMSCQVFIESMLKTGGGSVLNIGSVNSDRPLSRVFAYAASKAGVVNLTRNIAQEFAEQGIRVNAIAPGFFVTNQNRALLYDNDGKPTARTEKILRGTPMGRFGESDELLGALLFFVNDAASSFISGVILPVDGGFAAYSGV